MTTAKAGNMNLFYTCAPPHNTKRNKIHFDHNRTEAMDTVVMLDGLGRPLYTAKQGTVRGAAGVNEDGWNISGAVHYDQKGRTVSEGQTRFKALPLSGLLEYSPEAPLNPTRKEYDDLDRVVKTTLPDGAAQESVYQIRDGYSTVRSIDPKGNTGVQRTDSRGNIIYTARYGGASELLAEARYEYNGLGEMLAAYDHIGNPLEAGYDLSDYLGRMERIKYPDGEEVSYYYDNGGQIQKVQGKKPYYTEPYEYVKDIGYDEYGQRIYIEYGNGVQTRYTYDPLRRWLRAIETTGEGQVYQYINYEFDNENNF